MYVAAETTDAVTSPSAAEFREISASVTNGKGSKSLSMTLQQETQGGWTFVTTVSSPTFHQDVKAKHESLVMIVGNSVSLHCTSSVDVTFRWYYWSLGSRYSMWIYHNNRINHAFHRAASLSVSNCGRRNCTLTVGNFHLSDTGTFACLRGTVDKYWSFTILGKYIKQINIVISHHSLISDFSSKCYYSLCNLFLTFFLVFGYLCFTCVN